MTKPKMAATRSADHLPLDHPAEALFLVPDNNGFIQWPTEQEIQQVSRRLARNALERADRFVG